MNLSEPIVSVVVITFNSYVFVIETLESIRKQTYKNIELIISDDGSTDQTVRLCKDWVERNANRFVNVNIITVERNTGIPANCNRGIKASSGDWVKLIAGDDTMFSDCLEVYVQYIIDNPECKILTSNIIKYKNYFDENNRMRSDFVDDRYFNMTPEEQFECLLRVFFIKTPTIFVSRDVYVNCDYYDERLKLWEDAPFFLKATRNGFKIHHIDYDGCAYRVHGSSVQAYGSERLFSSFQVEAAKYLLENYIHFYGGFEKLVKFMLWSVITWIDKFGLNQRSLISLLFYNSLYRSFFYLNNKYTSLYL